MHGRRGSGQTRVPSGVDGISIGSFPKVTRPKWNLFKKELLLGAYQPSPALRVEIHKERVGVRLLGIPCVMDRVLASVSLICFDISSKVIQKCVCL